MATFAELVASFGSDVGKRGKQFEHFVKWFLVHDPEWSTQVDQIWLWEEYPDRWGIDCGIDLVFRHKNGEVWAVQAKCYSQQHDITKHDVDKFLSESNRKEIDKRLLIATTDRMGANAKQVCEAQEKSVLRYLRSNFESANIEYPASLAELNSARRKPKPAPRDHQLEAINNVVGNFQDVNRGQLIMACGTGKTFTTLWIKERLEAKSTLILLPSLGLLSQTLQEWTLATNVPFEVLCVCSDETVGKKGADEAIHSAADIAFPVTSNIEEIRKFLHRDSVKVVFATYQSSPLIAEAQNDLTVSDFDLTIADEAHRCAGKVGNEFTTVLDANLIRASKRLFATATPRTYSTNVKKAAGEYGIEVVGMDDETVFGKVLYSLPFGEAIKRGLLTDYRVVIIGVDNPTIAAWIKDRELVKTRSGIENDAESLAAQIGLLKAYKDYDLRRVISFHGRVKRAEQFSKDLIDVVSWIGDQHKPSGKIKSDFVSGEMATDKRRIKLSQLKLLAPHERGLLTNARCLSEGVDVPSLDGVAFIDPRSSQIDIIQAVGRAIRLNADKTAGTIILPVFIETGRDAASAIEASNFKPIWNVLNALKAHDDVLSAELDQIRNELGRRGGSTFDSTALEKIHIDLPSSVGHGFCESLRTYLVERVTDTWEYGYGALQAYSDLNGNCLVPNRYELANGFQLGSWAATQRKWHEKLSPERKHRLEVLKGWTWSKQGDAWERGFSHLQDYCNANGNCMVPTGYRATTGFNLGGWVGSQRSHRTDMPPDRRSRLEALDGWFWNKFDADWEYGFSNLKKYVETSGNCQVPMKYQDSKGFKLATWISTQRSNRNSISAERQALLETLEGWSWDPRNDAWEKGFVHLRNFSEQNGDCSVARSYQTSDGYQLGVWVSNNRHKRNAISLERRLRLEALPGWTWDAIDYAWEVGFARLREYSEVNGNSLVAEDFRSSDEYPLGSWVKTQRGRKDRMQREQQLRLEALCGWTWKPRDEAWEKGYRCLRQFSEQNGTCLIPQKYRTSDGFNLGAWVTKQRANQKKLPLERIKALELIDGWVWNSRDALWEEGFTRLREYCQQNGNCAVPHSLTLPDGYKLGNWVSNNRVKRQTMSHIRKSRLEALSGWTWAPAEDAWEVGFSHLYEYSLANGNCQVPALFKASSGFSLGSWVYNQSKNKDKTLPERRARLEALSGWIWKS